MDKKEFYEEMEKNLKELNLKLSDIQLNQFFDYMNILIEWNQFMNLTAIIEPKEIIIKHFIDSIMILKYINKNDKIIDVGTGAGFPGIPIKIAFPETEVVLLDSLNKRINFLNEVINVLKLDNIKTIHGRAEDYGKDKEYREMYDVSIARAVAPLNILSEYLIPFVKVGGKCICMKGVNLDEEILYGKTAIEKLGGKIVHTEEIFIPNTDIKRKIVEIEKKENTEKKYPRKAGTPSKEPL